MSMPEQLVATPEKGEILNTEKTIEAGLLLVAASGLNVKSSSAQKALRYLINGESIETVTDDEINLCKVSEPRLARMLSSIKEIQASNTKSRATLRQRVDALINGLYKPFTQHERLMYEAFSPKNPIPNTLPPKAIDYLENLALRSEWLEKQGSDSDLKRLTYLRRIAYILTPLGDWNSLEGYSSITQREDPKIVKKTKKIKAGEKEQDEDIKDQIKEHNILEQERLKIGKEDYVNPDKLNISELIKNPNELLADILLTIGEAIPNGEQLTLEFPMWGDFSLQLDVANKRNIRRNSSAKAILRKVINTDPVSSNSNIKTYELKEINSISELANYIEEYPIDIIQIWKALQKGYLSGANYDSKLALKMQALSAIRGYLEVKNKYEYMKPFKSFSFIGNVPVELDSNIDITKEQLDALLNNPAFVLSILEAHSSLKAARRIKEISINRISLMEDGTINDALTDVNIMYLDRNIDTFETEKIELEINKYKKQSVKRLLDQYKFYTHSGQLIPKLMIALFSLTRATGYKNIAEDLALIEPQDNLADLTYIVKQ